MTQAALNLTEEKNPTTAVNMVKHVLNVKLVCEDERMRMSTNYCLHANLLLCLGK